jgi:hypothetical protein
MTDLKNLVYSFNLDPPLDRRELNQFRDSSDPWQALAYLVARASEGDFSESNRIKDLMRGFESALFWSAATSFAGMAAPWGTISGIIEDFRARDHTYGVQYYLSNMTMYSCRLADVDTLFGYYIKGADNEIRDHVSKCLSLLIEDGSGLVWLGAKETPVHGGDDDEEEGGEIPDYSSMSYEELFATKLDYEGYRQVVDAALSKIVQSGASPGSAVFEGKVLDARQLANTVYERLQNREIGGRTYEGTRLLSAMTGLDCAKTTTGAGNVNHLETLAFIAKVLEEGNLDAMTPGVRYFFGHPIPD